MDILFNKEGTPLMISAQDALISTTAGLIDNKKKNDILGSLYEINEANTFVWKGRKYLNWGKNNNFPEEAAKIVASTSVLNTGLKFLRALTLGQGLYACKVTGYDEKGNEMLAPCGDKEVDEWLQSRNVRRYMEKASRDYFKFGNAAVQLIPNVSGNKFVGLQVINPLFYRYSVPDSMGRTKCGVSNMWPFDGYNGSEEAYTEEFDCLCDYDPDGEIDIMKAKKGRLNSVVFSLRDSWSQNDWYGEPLWLPALLLGWIDIAHMVPEFLRKAYQNQVTWKWHVQIPYSYWDKKYPRQEFKDVKSREEQIQKDMDKMEENLVGVKNAEKPLITHYAINETNGKIEEEWKIQALDNKYKGGENLVTSAAANSEILFCMMINPNVLGAMPSGNTYSSNQGGSNIREAYLINIANAWIDRSNLVDPLRTVLRANGKGDIQIRYRNTILTTLDTGAGTTKTLS